MARTHRNAPTADRLAKRRAVNRGARLDQLRESRERTAEILARNIGKLTEPDWRNQLARYEDRLREMGMAA